MSNDDSNKSEGAEPVKTGAAKSTGTRKRASAKSGATRSAAAKTGATRKSSTRTAASKAEPAAAESSAAGSDIIKRYLSPGRENATLIYVLYLAGTLFALTPVVGLVMAYINRGPTIGTWVESHYTYIIRTFWMAILYTVVSGLLTVIFIGFLLMIVVLIWAIVRCVKGLLWALDGDPVPDPKTWIL